MKKKNRKNQVVAKLHLFLFLICEHTLKFNLILVLDKADKLLSCHYNGQIKKSVQVPQRRYSGYSDVDFYVFWHLECQLSFHA